MTQKFIPSKPMVENETRPDVIAHLVEVGREVFSPRHNKIPYTFEIYNIMYWLLIQKQEEDLKISSPELNEVVDQVHAFANNVVLINMHRLTVGELKKRLEKVPDNTPVVYQRIEDSYFNKDTGWKTIPLEWDRHKAKPSDIEFVKNTPSSDYEIVEKDGVSYIRTLSHYIPAFSAFPFKNDKGELIFRIDAHY